MNAGARPWAARTGKWWGWELNPGRLALESTLRSAYCAEPAPLLVTRLVLRGSHTAVEGLTPLGLF